MFTKTQALQGLDYERLLVEHNAPPWLRKLRKYGFLEERPSRYAAPAI